MKHISKKIWFGLSVSIVAVSALFALKKPVHKEKSSHVVVDRLVNQLVCKFASKSAGSRNYPRGFAKQGSLSKRERQQSTLLEKYVLQSSQKVVTTARDGRQRGDKQKPVGGDFLTR